MKTMSWSGIGAVSIAGIFMVALVGEVNARSVRGGASSGGFSRASPAAGGGFSSARAQPSTRQQPTATRQQPAATGQRQDKAATSRGTAQDGRQESQGQRQDAANQNQSQRQDAASQNQSARQSTATQMQNTRVTTVNNYHGDCHNCDNWDNNDAAAGFVVGAIVGGAVVAASQPQSTTVVTTAPAPVAPPCNVAPIPVSGVPYYKCGGTWYTAGYASSGVVYVPVAPPPGY